MKTNYLFPHRLKWISGIVFVISFALLAGYYIFDAYMWPEYNLKVFTIFGNDGFLGDNVFFTSIENSVLDELLMLLVIPSGIVFAFSRERHEDELVASIRLHSLAWATIANYSIILLCYLLIYGVPFLNILMGAMFSQLLIFIILFRYRMYKFNTVPNEE